MNTKNEDVRDESLWALIPNEALDYPTRRTRMLEPENIQGLCQLTFFLIGNDADFCLVDGRLMFLDLFFLPAATCYLVLNKHLVYV